MIQSVVKLGLCLSAITLVACGGRTYSYDSPASTELIERAELQTQGTVSVRASVTGSAESEVIFGVPLYEKGAQPVWLEIRNDSTEQLRHAPVGTDPYYFSPLEVAWKHRGPYSKEARVEMERRFDDLSLPRYIQPGETVSGFVLTNFRPGVKAFNVDLFSDDSHYDFTFLIDVPGFRADYANVDFENLYEEHGFVDVDVDGLRTAISEFGCCVTDADGEPLDTPLNVILIGEGIDLLKSLLRGNWHGSSQEESAGTEPSFLFGRRQDAIFRYEGVVNSGYYELRLWLTPMTVDGNLVWAGEAKHVIDNAWSVTRDDPDVDLARDFLLQGLWYSQSLEKYGWVKGQEVIPVETIWAELFSNRYFTDGYRTVFWLSGDPVSIAEAERLAWDDPRAATRDD